MTAPNDPAFPGTTKKIEEVNGNLQLNTIQSLGFTAYEWVMLEFAKAMRNSDPQTTWYTLLTNAITGADEFFRQMEARK